MELHAKIGRWNELQRQLGGLKEEEAALRAEIFKEVFPHPTEGSNTADMPEGWKLKGTYKLNLSLDEAALPAVLAALRKKKVNTDAVILYKPALDTKAYRMMDPDHRHLLETAMVIKPGLPSLELVAPKK